jgi:hypothetical protein
VRRWLWLLAVVTVVAGWAACATPAGAADPTSQAISALRNAKLYVDPGATGITIDKAEVAASLPANVKVAVLPGSAGSALNLERQIGSAIKPTSPDHLVVGVLTTAKEFRAGSSSYCSGYADGQALAAVAAHRSQLQANEDVTALLEDFGRRVANGPLLGTAACGTGGSAVPTGNAGARSGNSGGSVLPYVAGAAAVGAGGIGGVVYYSRRKRRRLLDQARARVIPYYDRLANEINTLNPRDNQRAQQALADAAERFTSAGGQLADADTVEKYAQARRTVLEGLYAARTARDALGIDAGPQLPPIDEQAVAPQLQAPEQVTVQGQTFQGYPAYTPGAPYYFGGGYGVPGGWYATPFWETLLIGSVLAGGLGGFGGWGGYGAGYEAGYDQGRESADRSDGNEGGNAAGGDWSSSGGDSGGGDWGASGGDWGSGGGDWSGGDWGGGGDSGSSGDSGGSW